MKCNVEITEAPSEVTYELGTLVITPRGGVGIVFERALDATYLVKSVRVVMLDGGQTTIEAKDLRPFYGTVKLTAERPI